MDNKTLLEALSEEEGQTQKPLEALVRSYLRALQDEERRHKQAIQLIQDDYLIKRQKLESDARHPEDSPKS